MIDCIFTSYCAEVDCDKACPIFAQLSYLLDRNDIHVDNRIFKKHGEPVRICLDILDRYDKELAVIQNANVLMSSDLFAYCSICSNWKGSRLSCSTYTLSFSTYLDKLRNSWKSGNAGDSLEYMSIWVQTSKTLIINSLDYVKFKDFECQTLLNLIQSRQRNNRTTILILTKVDDLLGEGVFFDKLKKILSKAVVNYDNIN